jgi:hypothetical protein
MKQQDWELQAKGYVNINVTGDKGEKLKGSNVFTEEKYFKWMSLDNYNFPKGEIY